nr:hypothetical protein [Tanacetum cinerariifolium]
NEAVAPDDSFNTTHVSRFVGLELSIMVNSADGQLANGQELQGRLAAHLQRSSQSTHHIEASNSAIRCSISGTARSCSSISSFSLW